jgi:hypothetical protein
VPTSTSITPWNLSMPAGSYGAWEFAFATGVQPYPISGATWEYVVRVSQTDLTIPPLIEITTTVSAAGLITVTDATASLLLEIYAAATVNLPPGTYYQSLWMDPGDSNAFTWVTGTLVIQGNPQP